MAKKGLVAVVAAALTSGLLTPAAHAAVAVTIQVGGDVPKGFSVQIYAPLDNSVPTVKIHKDDVINIVGGLGLLPVGMDPWEAHSTFTGGLDRPFSLLTSDPDPDLQEPFTSDAPYKINPALTISGTCGGTEDAPCMFDGSGNDIFNPGDRESFGGNFFIQIGANPGDTVWATSIFAPNKHVVLQIEVVPNGDTTTTQAEVDDAYDTMHARDVDDAVALDAKMSAKATSHKDKETGKTVYDAWAGFDDGPIALLQMYPEKIKLDKGDTVRWHFDDLVNDFHTVTMPYKKALDISNNGFLPVCDPDGDGDGPDTFDVDFETFTCPPASGDLELDLTRDLTAQSGNGKFGGNGLESSGLKFSELPSAPGLAGGGESWDVKFTEKSNDEGYRYICAVHGKFMSGWVVVK